VARTRVQVVGPVPRLISVPLFASGGAGLPSACLIEDGPARPGFASESPSSRCRRAVSRSAAGEHAVEVLREVMPSFKTLCRWYSIVLWLTNSWSAIS
jgi:hypothetical protein